MNKMWEILESKRSIFNRFFIIISTRCQFFGPEGAKYRAA